MVKEKIIKVSKRITIILLIISFNIGGIISCGGEDITGSNFSETTKENTREYTKSNIPTWEKNYKSGDNTNNENAINGGDSNSTLKFPEDSSYSVYITPWTKRKGRGVYKPTHLPSNFDIVSYLDTNALTELWKGIIEGEQIGDGKKWAIRDVNIGKDTDSYYYFDNNLDIVHVYEKETANGKYGHVVKVKQFLGGVLVRYSGGEASPITVTVGGLYKTLLNKEKNNSQGKRGYTTYKYDNNLKNFMRAEHNWGEGDLSVIFMNVGFDNYKEPQEFGVDEYYCTIDNNYRKNPSYFLGKDPENYIGTIDNNYRWNNEKLNVRINHWNNFRFFRL